MDTKKNVMSILEELTGSNLGDKMDVNLFESGLLDSMATVQLVMELEEKCQVSIPISEFNRQEWETPSKIIAKVESLQ
ncbi:D-alanine--poly(phosphoribitol) ligase subunit DltC [Secundilactobacillus yichangensis]|uniref:D-alanine--poly(phosphoribitol) ligase subunit DltC n=1 Tax=Secundilactobacillus yichangensis TaxID=2799580 RepID=UPI0019409BAC|nr:D-alanine--poly(phosphoribitol) ligase subunit DltC [Secundilactobacillus yichangensis]